MIDYYTTGLTIFLSVIGSGLELSYITLAQKKLPLFESAVTISMFEKYKS